MPTTGWTLGGSLRVADVRAGSYLLIDSDSGAWVVTNESGFKAIAATQLFPRQAIGHGSGDPARPGTRPSYIIYKLTDSCNYRCSYCYDRAFARSKRVEQRNSAIRAVLSHALEGDGEQVHLLFHGGEPLSEFVEIRDVVQSFASYWPHRLQFAVQTNLSLLNQEMLDFLNEYRFGISISVDGITPVANRLRTLGGREDPYELVSRLTLDLRGLRRDQIGLLITVGPHNLTGLPEALLRMQDDGFRSVSFSLMQQAHGGAKAACEEALVSTLEEVLGLIVSGRLNELAVWTLIEWIRQVVHGRSEMVCHGSPCGAGRSLITVFPSGEVGPCDSVFDPRLYADSFESYLAERASLLSDLLARDTRTLEPCNSCDVRALCNGTCPGSAALANGAVDSVASAECAFLYRWIVQLMWQLGDPARAEPLLRYCAKHVGRRTHDYGTPI